MSVSDRIHTSLVSYGGSTIDERVYNYLGSLGLAGTISDRLAKYNHNGKKGWQAIIEGFGLSLSAGFVRQELFGESQQGVLYVSQPSYLGQQVLYQDAAGTTPVTADGDPVGLMLDLSPNGHNASQSTSAARPLYRTDGVLHWLEFDGVDDHMLSASISFGTLPFTLAVAAMPETATDGTIVGLGDGSASGGKWIITPEFAVRVQGGNEIYDQSAVTTDPEIIVSTFTGSQASVTEARVYVNGLELGVSSSTSQQVDLLDGLGIFSDGSGFGPQPGAFFGSVLSSEVVSNSVRAHLENYLASLAGLTL